MASEDQKIPGEAVGQEALQLGSQEVDGERPPGTPLIKVVGIGWGRV